MQSYQSDSIDGSSGHEAKARQCKPEGSLRRASTLGRAAKHCQGPPPDIRKRRTGAHGCVSSRAGQALRGDAEPCRIELLDSAQVGPELSVSPPTDMRARQVYRRPLTVADAVRAFNAPAARRESYDQSFDDHYNAPEPALTSRHRSPTLPSDAFAPFRVQPHDSAPDWREPDPSLWQAPRSAPIQSMGRSSLVKPLVPRPAVFDPVRTDSPPETASSKALDTPSRSSSYHSEHSTDYMTRNRGSTSSTFSQIITSPRSQTGDDLRISFEKSDSSSNPSPFSYGLGLAFTPPDDPVEPVKRPFARESDPIVPAFANLGLNDSIWGLNTSAEPFKPKTATDYKTQRTS